MCLIKRHSRFGDIEFRIPYFFVIRLCVIISRGQNCMYKNCSHWMLGGEKVVKMRQQNQLLCPGIPQRISPGRAGGQLGILQTHVKRKKTLTLISIWEAMIRPSWGRKKKNKNKQKTRKEKAEHIYLLLCLLLCFCFVFFIKAEFFLSFMSFLIRKQSCWPSQQHVEKQDPRSLQSFSDNGGLLKPVITRYNRIIVQWKDCP